MSRNSSFRGTDSPSGNTPSREVGMILEPDSDVAQPTRPLRLSLPAARRGTDNPLARLSWQPKKADAVWTRQEWTALADHLHNENPPTHFVMAFRKNGKKQYVRSKTVSVQRAISWAWTTICGTSKSPLAFVPYAHNGRSESRWGGLDFDAHDGNADRARELAFAAFRVLLNVPDLAVVLETSGSGGWHVWAICQDFHPLGDWVRLLKSVCGLIGATIAPSVCEVFPPDSLPSPFGKGLRAPGCWNPATDSFSEIVWENTRSFLGSVLSGNSQTAPLNCTGLQSELPDKRKKLLSLPPSYREDELLQRFGITLPHARNEQLSGLVGEVFHQIGQATARGFALAQFQRKTVATQASEQEHMASFEALWDGLAKKWAASLAPAEVEAFGRLATDNERDAFRIIRNFARKADRDGAIDFPIARDSLAGRLGVSGPGAGSIRDKLASMGIIKRTADYVCNKTAARYKWLLGSPKT